MTVADDLRVTTVIDEIAAERQRQINAERWTPVHDDTHTDGSLARAAACYALPEPEIARRTEQVWPPRGEYPVHVPYDVPKLWPSSWHSKWWKPTDRRRDLVKAGALILAEIERLDRAIAAQSKERQNAE